MKTFQELAAEIRKTLPYADIQLDNDGQIIIYTNLTVDETGTKLEPYEVQERSYHVYLQRAR